MTKKEEKQKAKEMNSWASKNLDLLTPDEVKKYREIIMI